MSTLPGYVRRRCGVGRLRVRGGCGRAVVFVVIDVSTPSAPVEVGFVGHPTPGAVRASRCRAATPTLRSELGSGLRVIDVSTPSAPVEVGFWHAPVALQPRISRCRAATPTWRTTQDRLSGDRREHAVRAGRGGLAVTPDVVEGCRGLGRTRVLARGDAGLYVFNECDGASSRTAASPSSRRRRWRPAPRAPSSRPTSRSTTPGPRRRRSPSSGCPAARTTPSPMESEPIALAPGQSLRYENVLTELFGLGPDSLGALKLVASTDVGDRHEPHLQHPRRQGRRHLRPGPARDPGDRDDLRAPSRSASSS